MADTLFFQFGIHQQIIELLVEIFPDGDNSLPKLKDVDWQSWTLNTLSGAYAMTGEPHKAISYAIRNIENDEKNNRKEELMIGLGNLATQQFITGMLSNAEFSSNRQITLCQEREGIHSKFSEGMGHLTLGRTFAYRGLWVKAKEELDTAILIQQKIGQTQSMGLSWAYQALRSLLMARDSSQSLTQNYQSAIQSASRSLELAGDTAKTNHPYERDFIRAHWFLGAAHRANNDLKKAEKHLSESLRRCRAINNVEMEASILLEVAKLRHSHGSQDESEEALRLVQEALIITEHSGYVLQGADVNLFLAELAMEGILPSDEVTSEELAKEYAQKALKLAHCDDGPPYHYNVAYEEAERLLARLEKQKL